MSTRYKPTKRNMMCVFGIGVVGLVVSSVIWKHKKPEIKQRYRIFSKSLHDLNINMKSHVYLQHYSWARYFMPLLINNLAIVSMIRLYQNYSPSFRHLASPHRHKTDKSQFLKLGKFTCSESSFFATDILLLCSTLNVLFCKCLDALMNRKPVHPLMLFESYVEDKFITEYKHEVNKIINTAINNGLDNQWLIGVIWKYITYDTKQSHMIIDVKFTNKELKHESAVCRKYKSILASLFSQYQQDMQSGYSLKRKVAKTQPDFGYFWQIKTLGLDLNAFDGTSFKLYDAQQMMQFIMWAFVNFGVICGFDYNDRVLFWSYIALVFSREHICWDLLLHVFGAKWIFGGIYFIPQLYYYRRLRLPQQTKKNYYQMVSERKRRKRAPKQDPPDTSDQEWFWKYRSKPST